jgi:hypothetical protein
MSGFFWSGWQDSNLRPPAPKAGAITGLRYTPNWLSILGLQIYSFSLKINSKLFFKLATNIS